MMTTSAATIVDSEDAATPVTDTTSTVTQNAQQTGKQQEVDETQTQKTVTRQQLVRVDVCLPAVCDLSRDTCATVCLC